MALKHIYTIDGRDFATLEEFFDVVERSLIPGAWWGRNLDAFNDILRGGFGTPEEGFVLRWENSDTSRRRLGYPETIRQLELRLVRCHSENRARVAGDLAAARAHDGPAVFDWLVEIVEDHCEGGGQAEDGLELVLA